jgi:hypothetical protein
LKTEPDNASGGSIDGDTGGGKVGWMNEKSRNAKQGLQMYTQLKIAIGFAAALIAHSSLNAQETTTLICQDSDDPALSYALTVDFKNNKVIGDNYIENQILDNVIVFSKIIGGNTHKTVISRQTGQFTVFVSGRVNGKFTGTCSKKTSNKF